MKLPLLALPTLALALSACGAADPTRDRDDLRAFNNEIAFIEQNSVRTGNADLPVTSTSGQVEYNGEIGADVRINGVRGYTILGDLEMAVGFAGSRDVDGSVDDITLFRNGTEDQNLRGTLDLFGQQASGKIDAVAEGVLTRTTDSNFDERTNLFLDLNGTVRSVDRDADTILGTVDPDRSFGDGFGTGVPPLRTFNVFVENGAFYANR